MQHLVDAVAKVVTDATGLSGEQAIQGLVASIGATPWPIVTAVAGVLVVAGGVFTLATAHRWSRGGRRYERDAAVGASAGARPHDAARDDAIDSWDDLSHGDDPTVR